jgi:TolB-like protein/DNA-binding winged helix-turn-helix (wHTH) protein/tetratricopeptide (TPR) repeat protein
MEPAKTLPRVVRFGVFELDRRSGELRREGVRIRLQEQPLRVLDALLEAAGEPVAREALRQRLWPDDTFVDFDNGLNRAINRLRAALGDEAGNPRFIETLERRGYRFIAPVATPEADLPAGTAIAPEALREERGAGGKPWIGAAAAAAALAAVTFAVMTAWRRDRAPQRPAIRSLAVLPLANLTGDPAQDYFSDGMTDALITNLASLPALRVISRQSVMRYKGSDTPMPAIARELGVEGIVEGSVVRSAGRVRITAQLIHAPTDRHLWARSYERPLEDVLALQGELSRAIAEEVRITLAAKEAQRLTPERTVDPEAYDSYLLGRHHWNLRSEPSLGRALEHFQAALARDPDFALAHAGLAVAYAPRLALGYVPPGEGLAELKAAARRALELDEGLGDARAALAVARVLEWDWTGAESEFRRAIDADPSTTVGHLWYGWYLHALGRVEESLVQRRRALELDPLSAPVNRGVARELSTTGQEEAALAQWNRSVELEPRDARSHVELALFHFERGRPGEGSRHVERARALGPDDASTLASLAVVYAAGGNRHEARRLEQRLRAEPGRYVSPVLRAYVLAALGDREGAFTLLEQAYAARDPLLLSLPMCDIQAVVRLTREQAAALRADPRYGDLLRRMGLPLPPATAR